MKSKLILQDHQIKWYAIFKPIRKNMFDPV